MATSRQFQTQLTYQQVAQLVRQLPAKDKQKLAKLLETETATPVPPVDETILTPAERNVVANVRQGFREMKMVQEGKPKTQPLSDLFDEL